MVDVGRNGAFTELVVKRCAPAEVHGIDPSKGQLKYARARPATRMAEFRQGDAMALPFPDNSFDLAVMALVIFRSRSRQRRSRDGAGGFPRRHGGGLCLGHGRAVDFLCNRSKRNCSPWALLPFARPALTLQRSMPFKTCGRMRGSTALKRGKSRYNERLPISKTFGRQPCWDRRLVRQLPLWLASDRDQLKTRVRAHLPADGAGRITTAHGQMR